MLLHTVYPGLGGAGTVSIDLIDYFLKTKLKKNNFICFFGKEKVNKDFLQILNKRVPYFEIVYSSYLIGNFRFLKLLFKLKPKKVLMHNYLILPLLFYKIFYKLEIFTVIHSDPLILKQDYKKNMLFRFLIYFVCKFSNKLILVNHDKASFNLFTKYKSKIVVIPNPIDVTKFKKKNSKLKKKNNFINIGIAARLTQKNRLDLLLRAIKKLNLKKPIFKLYIAGAGDSLNQLKKLTQSLKISKYIIFEGQLKKKELIKFYKKLDIYSHISEHEFMSTSILQAMSMSLNVIASNLLNNKFLLKASNKNLLVKNDVISIVSAINKLTKYSHNIKKSNLENRKFVMTNNKLSKIAEKYIKLIKL